MTTQELQARYQMMREASLREDRLREKLLNGEPLTAEDENELSCGRIAEAQNWKAR